MTWYVFSLLSALFSSFAAVTQKKVLFKNKALEFSSILALFNLVLAIPFFFFIDFQTLNILNISVLFLKSVLGAITFLLVMLGIKKLEISRALPLLVLTPGIVAIFAFITLGETLTIIEIIGIILLIAGTYIFSLKKQKIKTPLKEAINPKGHYYIILALILFAVTSILDKAILNNFKLPLNAFMGFQHLFLGIIFSIMILTQKNSQFKKTFTKTWKLILLISFFTITYRYTHLLAIKSAPVALALSIKRISVFFAVILGGTLFREHNLIKKIIATAIMTIGAILVING
jgi:drug/metabolite transporter (DMT)-like permease